MADTDKTHDPTPRRRQQARADGRVAHSSELASTILLLGSFGMLALFGAGLIEFLIDALRSGLGGGAWKSWTTAGQEGTRLAASQWNDFAPQLARRLLPLIGGAAILAVAAHLVQTGLIVRTERVAPDFGRISPLAGFGRIFSAASLGRLVVMLVKLGIVGAVAFSGLWQRRDELAGLSGFELPELSGRLWELCSGTVLQIGGVLLAMAAADYAYQWLKLQRELRMTAQELREELRELEGDPRLRARRRDLARKATQATGQR